MDQFFAVLFFALIVIVGMLLGAWLADRPHR